jgi:hypothetical protein
LCTSGHGIFLLFIGSRKGSLKYGLHVETLLKVFSRLVGRPLAYRGICMRFNTGPMANDHQRGGGICGGGGGAALGGGGAFGGGGT